MSNMTFEEATLSVDCPTCGAREQEACVTPRGVGRPTFHTKRQEDGRKLAALERAANRRFPSRDGAPGQVWIGGLDESRPISMERTGRVQFVTEDNIISVYFDLDGNLVINGDRSFNLQLGGSNNVTIVKRD